MRRSFDAMVKAAVLFSSAHRSMVSKWWTRNPLAKVCVSTAIQLKLRSNQIIEFSADFRNLPHAANTYVFIEGCLVWVDMLSQPQMNSNGRRVARCFFPDSLAFCSGWCSGCCPREERPESEKLTADRLF